MAATPSKRAKRDTARDSVVQSESGLLPHALATSSHMPHSKACNKPAIVAVAATANKGAQVTATAVAAVDVAGKAEKPMAGAGGDEAGGDGEAFLGGLCLALARGAYESQRHAQRMIRLVEQHGGSASCSASAQVWCRGRSSRVCLAIACEERRKVRHEKKRKSKREKEMGCRSRTAESQKRE